MEGSVNTFAKLDTLAGDSHDAVEYEVEKETGVPQGFISPYRYQLLKSFFFKQLASVPDWSLAGSIEGV